MIYTGGDCLRFRNWFNLGIGIKRWVALGFSGMFFIVFGVFEMIFHRYYNFYYKLFYVYLIAVGLFTIYLAMNEGVTNFVGLVEKGMVNVNLDSREIGGLVHERKLLVQGPKVVVIGGGTGLSTLLRGLKHYTNNITAVVTVADDGGGSGKLREDLGILPPGDIRNCLVALANTDTLMEDLMQYRFQDGSLKGQSFGNLFLAAMDGVSDNFEDAVAKMANVLAITGKVLPVTLEDLRINAELESGQIVIGESHIPVVGRKEASPIKRLYIEPSDAKCLPDAAEAIRNADAVVLGPGSLFTSIIPNLLVKGIVEAIRESKGLKIYISNVMTQPGETDGFRVSDHVRSILAHADFGNLDYVIANTTLIDNMTLKEKYGNMGQTEVLVDRDNLSKYSFELVLGDFLLAREDSVRHDAEKLSRVLMDTILRKSLIYDKKRILEYVLLSDKLKNRERMHGEHQVVDRKVDQPGDRKVSEKIDSMN